MKHRSGHKMGHFERFAGVLTQDLMHHFPFPVITSLLLFARHGGQC